MIPYGQNWLLRRGRDELHAWTHFQRARANFIKSLNNDYLEGMVECFKCFSSINSMIFAHTYSLFHCVCFGFGVEGPCSIVQAGLELPNFLSQHPEFWGHNCAWPCIAFHLYLGTLFCRLLKKVCMCVCACACAHTRQKRASDLLELRW